MVRVVAVLIGYALAVTLHALWNGSASLQGGEAFIGVYAFIMVPLFLAMIAIVVWQRRREQRIVIEQLPGFAQAGWIAPSEIALLSSLAGRRGWRAAVRRRSGKQVAKAVTDYQAAVTDLAFLRSRMARGSVGGETGVFWHGEALAELSRARDRAIGHPEALTMALRHHGPSGWTPPPPGPPPGAAAWPGRPQSYPAAAAARGRPSSPAGRAGRRSARSPRGRRGAGAAGGPPGRRPRAEPAPAAPRIAAGSPPGRSRAGRPATRPAGPAPRADPPLAGPPGPGVDARTGPGRSAGRRPARSPTAHPPDHRSAAR